MTLQSLCLKNASFCLACQPIYSSYFFFPKLLESDERMSLLAVMLYDFQDRKFNTRELQDRQEVIHEVRDMEEFLLRYRGKKKQLKFRVITNKIWECVNNNNNVFLLRVSCAGLKPGWQRLWPAAGSKTTSYPLTTSCRRTWRRWTGAHAGFRSTPGSTPWRPGWLAFSLVHTHTPVQKPASHCKRGKKKSVCELHTQTLTLGFCPVFYDPDVQLTFN